MTSNLPRMLSILVLLSLLVMAKPLPHPSTDSEFISLKTAPFSMRFIERLHNRFSQVQHSYNLAVARSRARELAYRVQKDVTVVMNNLAFEDCGHLNCPPASHVPAKVGLMHDLCACVSAASLSDERFWEALETEGIAEILAPDFAHLKNVTRRSSILAPLSRDTNFTYVPPPKTDITPELLNQSLSVQPQDTATVGSVVPYFRAGVISYGIQLNGFVAGTISLNATIDLPCDSIGMQPQPDLELRPKEIDNGTTQVYIPDCSIIAVNMYNPNVINYWVQNNNGSIFSLVGSNKVVNIGQLNSTASISLVLRAKLPGTTKRELSMHDYAMAGATIHKHALDKKTLSVPDAHTASMTAEACAAMICNNNGSHPALFNPFTKTCGCRDPVYVEVDHSA